MRLVPLAVAVLLVGFLVAGVGVTSASEPDISVDDSIDTPEETIELEGSTYEVSAIAERVPGEDLTVEVGLPDDSSGELDLYDSDENVADWENVDDGDTVTFNTSQLEPGTYMLALQIDGSYEAVHPVIISGYDMTLSHPTEAAPSESITVTVDVAQTRVDEPPAGVDVVVHGAGDTIDVTADKIDDETYEATMDFDEHAEGEYQVYAAARDGGEAAGYPTLLGATAGETITVSADDDDDSDDSDEESDSEQDQEDEQDSDESDDEETANGDEDDSDTDDEVSDNGTDDSDEADEEESDEESSVIDPNGDDDESEPVDDEQSLSLIVSLLGLILGGIVATRRLNS